MGLSLAGVAASCASYATLLEISEELVREDCARRAFAAGRLQGPDTGSHSSRGGEPVCRLRILIRSPVAVAAVKGVVTLRYANTLLKPNP